MVFKTHSIKKNKPPSIEFQAREFTPQITEGIAVFF